MVSFFAIVAPSCLSAQTEIGLKAGWRRAKLVVSVSRQRYLKLTNLACLEFTKLTFHIFAVAPSRAKISMCLSGKFRILRAWSDDGSNRKSVQYSALGPGWYRVAVRVMYSPNQLSPVLGWPFKADIVRRKSMTKFPSGLHASLSSWDFSIS
jgi:hypothetical protein